MDPDNVGMIELAGNAELLFEAFEQNAEWLDVCTPGEYLSAHTPLGRADLPTASYTEMMEWALRYLKIPPG